MKRSRFTEEQIIWILREQEAGVARADVFPQARDFRCHVLQVEGGMDVSEARRLKVLEDENAKLKRLLAEAILGNAMLKDIATSARISAAGRTVPVTVLGPLKPPCEFRLTSSSSPLAVLSALPERHA